MVVPRDGAATARKRSNRVTISDSYEAQPNRNKCKTCDWIATLGEQDQQYLRNMAINLNTDIRRLYRAAKDNGLDAGETSFRDHIQVCVRKTRERAGRSA